MKSPFAESNGSRNLSVWLGLLLTLAIQLCAFFYGYGALNTRVDALKENVQQLQIDVRNLLQKK